MKVILLQHVRGLGQKGEVKEVSDGYFRNMLAPRKLARPATGGAVNHIKNQKAKAVEKLENMKESAEAVKSKIDGKVITLKEKVADTGKLYAAVSSKEVAEAIEAQLKAKVPAKNILMEEHIKSTGEHKLEIKLYKGISAHLTLDVQAA